MKPDEALPLIRQMAEALEATHAGGVIHRDFKPSNVMLAANGSGTGTRVIVTDFGLACTAPSGEELTALTESRQILGTPDYMAPEQLMNGQLDGRADLWAVGVVLYECLSGRTPFDTDAPVRIASKMIDRDFPAIGTLIPNIPPRLEAIVSNLLQLHVKDRIQTAGDLSRQLAEIEAPPAG